jgi:pyruvate-formate lyase
MTAQISESVLLKRKFGSGERPYSERIARLRENFLASPYEANIERARYYTRSHKQTEGESPCLRAAKGLEETLRHMSIRIEEDERLVGAKTFKKIAGPIGIERSSKSMVILLGTNFHNKEVDDIGFLDRAGNQNPEFLKSLLNMPEEMHRELTEEILPFWKGKDIRSKMINGWKKAGLYKPNEPDSSPVEIADMQGHVTAGLKKVLSTGFKGIATQAAEQLTRIEDDDKNFGQRQDFLESVQVAARAVCDHAERYATLAEEMAQEVEGPRKKELIQIAARCRRVPAEPPRTFLEALQSIWMTPATCETHRFTAGVAFYNDAVVIRDLVKDGYALECPMAAVLI